MNGRAQEKLLGDIGAVVCRADVSPQEKLDIIGALLACRTEDISTPHTPFSLPVLFRLANTLLSTIRLNKLIHLLLSVLVSESSSLFERSMIFLRVEKTGILQGMVGITSEESRGLVEINDSDDALSGCWDLPEEVIQRQRASSFCSVVRSTRVEPHSECPISLSISDGKPVVARDSDCNCCVGCGLISRFGIHTFAIVPLISGASCLGILILDNPVTKKQVSREEYSTLRFISTQAGMAVEHSLLYNRLESAIQDLKDAQERLVHGERLAAIGEMAANVVHELKNPLITIGGFAGRLLKKLPENTPEQKCAKTIVNEVGRLETLLADILAFSRKPTICFSLCDLAGIVKDCLAGLYDSFRERGISIAMNIPSDRCSIHGDAYQLKQVFLNLAINSSDAMKDGGTLQVTIAPRRSGYEVTFQDTGGGIPQDLLPRIFTPFFTTKQHGTGLGLPIANRLVLNHNGTMEAFNTADGALFRIFLPAAVVEND